MSKQDFSRIQYLIQRAPKGWTRVVTTGGVYVAAFMTQADAIAWCEAQS